MSRKKKKKRKTNTKYAGLLAERKLSWLHRAETALWERILNVCKSSWLPCIEVKRDVDIYYGPIAAKLTPQILRPEHRKYKYDLTDQHWSLWPHLQPVT